MDQQLIAREFPQSEDLIYLNHAAVSPWPARTRNAVTEFASENVTLGAKNYTSWMKKEGELRRQLQWLINAPSPDDIALLKNTSEALSVVACGLDWQAGDNIVSSSEEFPSNRIPWQAQEEKGVEFREINIRVDSPEQALIDACDTNTRILTISSVQYGSGIYLDLAIIGKFCRDSGILFCVDAIQSIGSRVMDVQAIQADFVMADAHKWMLGPEGIAVLYSRPEARNKLTLHQFGWHMLEIVDFSRREWEIAHSARRFECGSPNMLGIHALSASLTLFEEIGLQAIEDSILANISYLFQQLSEIQGIEFLTPRDKKRHAGILNFTIANTDMQALHRELVKNNVICVYRGGGLRLSPHFYNSRKLLDKSVEIIHSSI
jgi:cysteine desulfurase/selenocysteine lyase